MKIAVLFPAFMGGGAEAVCAWMLEALKNDHDVTLFTAVPVDLGDLDKHYGTDLRNAVTIRIYTSPIPRPLRKLISSKTTGYAVRQFALMRVYKGEFANKFDVAISAFNEMDLGRAGIQYVHLPMFGRGHEVLREEMGHPNSALRRLYRELLRVWSGYCDQRMRQNVTLTNSKWTAGLIKRVYGIDAQVIYPPVHLKVPRVPWEARGNTFLLVSRVVREKKVERAIRIISEVRRAGFDVRLRILSGGVADPEYLKELRTMAADDDWVIWEPRLPREQYASLLASARFGIHARENEQFGIGVAEMVCAGVIPFVPSEGGQTEIIDGNSWLMWRDEREAVRKIVEVLRNQNLQRRLTESLQHSAGRWSVERFIREIRDAVQEFAQRMGRAGR